MGYDRTSLCQFQTHAPNKMGLCTAVLLDALGIDLLRINMRQLWRQYTLLLLVHSQLCLSSFRYEFRLHFLLLLGHSLLCLYPVRDMTFNYIQPTPQPLRSMSPPALKGTIMELVPFILMYLLRANVSFHVEGRLL